MITLILRRYRNDRGTFHPDASGTINWQYDDNGRLTRETSARNNDGYYSGTYDFTHAWDAADNPIVLRSIARSYNADNQNTANLYDADGNTQIWGMEFYGVEKELYSDISYYGSFSAYYRPDGLRSAKFGSQAGPYFLYDGDRLICEFDINGTLSWVYGWSPNGLVGLSNAQDSSFNYNVSFDPQGTLVQRDQFFYSFPADVWNYDAFGLYRGSAIYSQPRLDEPIGFAGQHGAYFDRETDPFYDTNGQVFMGYRYYYPGTARFITRDPLSYDAGANLYVYCEGDPVNRVDPMGLDDGDGISGIPARSLGSNTSLGNNPITGGNVTVRMGEGLQPFTVPLRFAGAVHPLTPACELLTGKDNEAIQLTAGGYAMAVVQVGSGPGLRFIGNALKMMKIAHQGKVFEQGVIAALGADAAKNYAKYAGTALNNKVYNVIPDVVQIGKFTEAKSNLLYVPFRRQMQAMVDAAKSNNCTLNLIVGPNATVSPRLRKAIRGIKGKIQRSDPSTGQFSTYR